MVPSFRILAKKVFSAPKVPGRVIVIFRVWVVSSLNCSRMIAGTCRRPALRRGAMKVKRCVNVMPSSFSLYLFQLICAERFWEILRDLERFKEILGDLKRFEEI